MLKSCAMWAKKKKKEPDESRELIDNTAKTVYNAKHCLIRPHNYKISAKLDVQSSHKYWNWDCGLPAMDYGSETMGYIRTINSGINFFFLA